MEVASSQSSIMNLVLLDILFKMPCFLCKMHVQASAVTVLYLAKVYMEKAKGPKEEGGVKPCWIEEEMVK